MVSLVTALRETLVAVVAGEGPITGVTVDVRNEMARLRERFLADLADERTLA